MSFHDDHDPFVMECARAITEEQINYLRTKRFISADVVRRYKLGFDRSTGRFSIPVYDRDNQLLDVRLWLPLEERGEGEHKSKIIPKTPGVSPSLFPLDQLSSNRLIVVEGELDALAGISAGLPTITNTCGANTWKTEFSSALAQKQIVILLDNDGPGIKGTEKRGIELSKVGSEVLIAEYPLHRASKHDLIDELLQFGPESLKQIIDLAEPFEWEGRTVSKLRRLDQITPSVVEYHWDPYLPKGMLVLLDGDPGIGKSFLCCYLAGILSKGGVMPGNSNSCSPVHVLIMNSEDAADSVIKPRFSKMEHDPEKISILEFGGVLDPEGDGLMELQRQVDLVNPGLLIIDPLISYLGDRDMNKASDVRPVLRALSRLARKRQMTILGVRHLNKNSEAKTSIYRGAGSIDFVGAARSVIFATKKEGEKLVHLFHAKSSNSEAGKSQCYEIVGGRVEWRGESTASYQEFCAPECERESVVEGAAAFLIETLQGGVAIPSNELFEMAKANGFSKASVQRAKRSLLNLVVKRVKDGWVWQMEPIGKTKPAPEDSQGNARH